MQRLKLSPGGPEVSRLAYGVWRLAEDSAGSSPARVEAKIQACLDRGITTFDHADIYGGYICEGLFGQVLKTQPGLRRRMELVTKCDINAPGPNRPGARLKYYDASAAAIESCVERSLRELGTDHVDLLLIHRPDWLTRADDTAAALNRLVKAGKIRSAGVSNFSPAQFDLLNAFVDQPLVTNQIEVSLLQMKAMFDGTLDQCQRLGISPMAWSPLAGGRFFDPKDAAAGRVREAAKALAPRYGGAGLDQLALAWILALPSRPVVILGTNDIARIHAASEADQLVLDRQDWYALWTAAAGAEVP
jgi:predicted oxidoreductase